MLADTALTNTGQRAKIALPTSIHYNYSSFVNNRQRAGYKHNMREFAKRIWNAAARSVRFGALKRGQLARRNSINDMRWFQRVEPAWLLASCLLVSNPVAARTLVVNRMAAAANDQNAGTPEEPLKTIQRAAELALPGDTVLVHAGVYRERVAPARGGRAGRPIIYRAAAGERVIIKGSEVWTPTWVQPDTTKRVYSAQMDDTLFLRCRIHPYRTLLAKTPGRDALTLGQLFVNGRTLTEVSQVDRLEEIAGTWRVSADGRTISIHLPDDLARPEDGQFELTVRERIFAPHQRGLGHIHVIGFVMEHCANQFPDQFWRSKTPQAG
ncbi:MAG: hypothetical protein KDA92_06915, partial [Planctomycetales bacterium]|nr:hypothetical protein [Planctomycetales bacterium]